MTDDPEATVEGAAQTNAAEDAPAYEIQLTGVRTWEVEATRPVASTDEGIAEPAVEAGRTYDWIADDRMALRVRWRAIVQYPYTPSRSVSISCTVEGRFTSNAPVPPRAFDRFKEREAFVLLWPYLRANVAQVAAMMDVKVPPLPTLDVRKVVGPRRRPAPRPTA